MSFASRHNKGARFDVNIEGFEKKKLVELFNEDPEAIHLVQGIFSTDKGEYGRSYFIASDGFCVYLPQHMNDECIDILSSSDDIDAIKGGMVGFSVYSYDKEDAKTHKTKTYYSIKWEDIE